MKSRAYIDIETTGLSRYYNDLTVIGIGLEKRKIVEVIQLIEDDLNEKRLLRAIKGVDEIYSYNGALPLFYVPVVMRVFRTYSPCLEEGAA